MHTSKSFLRSVMLLLLTSVLAACATKPEPLPPVVVQGPKVQPLPALAKQPATPPMCSPTCSQGLMRERENWRALLMNAASQGQPASGPTR